jgi:hypothetical protein
VSVASHRFDNDLRYRGGDHPHQTALTPEYVLEPVREALGWIELDPCTTLANPTNAERIYALPRHDGLAMPWDAERIFVNPPYGKAREPWVDHCIRAGTDGSSVILLMPAHTDTRCFQRAMESADAVVFIRGRLKFGVLRPNRRQVAASHPSCLIGWNVDLEPCAHLGVVLALVSREAEASE